MTKLNDNSVSEQSIKGRRAPAWMASLLLLGALSWAGLGVEAVHAASPSVSSKMSKMTAKTAATATATATATRQLDKAKKKPATQAVRPATRHRQVGQASWYGPGFHGRKTANGEIFNQHQLTAAHRRLPLGTKVKVTNLKNGKAVVVRVNDRGPYVGGRIIDLSRAAAQRLAISGLGQVRVEALY